MDILDLAVVRGADDSDERGVPPTSAPLARTVRTWEVRGPGPKYGLPIHRVYGGQTLSQALMAAALTVPAALQVHSMHAYFFIPGDPSRPFTFVVEEVRNGASFAGRKVTARQEGSLGEPSFMLLASFTSMSEEGGFEHTTPLPTNFPGPYDLPSTAEWASRALGRKSKLSAESEMPASSKKKGWLESEQRSQSEMLPMVIEHRIAEKFDMEVRGARNISGEQVLWIRVREKIPPGTASACVALFLCDYHMVPVALMRHRVTIYEPEKTLPASLDHSMWFHRVPLSISGQWICFVLESPLAHRGRSLTTGRLYNQDGDLIASLAQEGLVRKNTRGKELGQRSGAANAIDRESKMLRTSKL